MIACKLSQIAKSLDCQLINGDADIYQVYTDTRQAVEGGLFVALKGPHFDAHEFLAQVVEQGAAGVVVEQRSSLPIPQLIVEDSRKALAEIARFNRSALDAKFIGITGSSGKTTVKEMLASILQLAGNTFATKGNLNNEIGVPLSLLEMNESHDYGVIEMGANHAGEIAMTAGITRPQVAMINNVAAAHLEGFGDLQGVAQAKSEIYGEIVEGGTAVVNVDDDFSNFWLQKIERRSPVEVLTYGIKAAADVSAKDIELDENKCPTFKLIYKEKSQRVFVPLSGEHNVNNALAAASCALALGTSMDHIAQGLVQTPVVSGRLMIEQMANGCRLIDDTYNANMDSMRAAISLLETYGHSRILVIGDMAELGAFGRQCHEEIGEFANQKGIEKMYSCGVLSQFAQAAFSGEGAHYSNQQELITKLINEAKADTTILVKGSRSAHMEKVVLALMENSENENQRFASSGGEN